MTDTEILAALLLDGTQKALATPADKLYQRDLLVPVPGKGIAFVRLTFDVLQLQQEQPT